ncbi:MAG: GntR family transcriptional regulator [Aminivibrio sp.]|jgi:DNA-binding GntR family transcriptional regulator
MRNSTEPVPEREEKLKDLVDRHIREQIFQKKTLRSGDQIHERELARMLGLSRAPVREALKQLEEQGLVEAIKYRGWFVAEFLAEDLQEINKIRALLEYNLFLFILSRGGVSDRDLKKATGLNRKLEQILNSNLSKEEQSFEFAEQEMEFHFFLYSLAGDGCRWTRKILTNISYQIRCGLHQWIYDTDQMRMGIKSHDNLIKYLRRKDKDSLSELLFSRLKILPGAERFKRASCIAGDTIQIEEEYAP